jgi:HAD superfamily hydrolase (TIGR01509 family)
MSQTRQALLFDLDGTLVDSTYQHVRIWHDVLQEQGWLVPQHRIHRGIGLPANRLLRWLLEREPESLKHLEKEHERRFAEAAASLAPTTGALELLADLDEREVPYLAVTSAGEEIRALLFKALGRSMEIAPDKGSKPDADPMLSAAKALKCEPSQLTMIGDAIWDGEAARRSGMHFIGLRCGGTSDELLKQAGALWVEDAPRDLIGRL